MTYDINDILSEVHSVEKWLINSSFQQNKLACNYTVNIYITNNFAPGMKPLKFIYTVFSILEGYPGTNPRQQVAKQGPGEPEVAQGAAVIRAQLLERVVEVVKICVPLED